MGLIQILFDLILNVDNSFHVFCLFSEVGNQCFDSLLVPVQLNKLDLFNVRNFDFVDCLEDQLVDACLVFKLILANVGFHRPKFAFVVALKLFFQIRNHVLFLECGLNFFCYFIRQDFDWGKNFSIAFGHWNDLETK
jgi:hypothetical protein